MEQPCGLYFNTIVVWSDGNQSGTQSNYTWTENVHDKSRILKQIRIRGDKITPLYEQTSRKFHFSSNELVRMIRIAKYE